VARLPDPVAVPAFWLSMHVAYACRDEGACCSSGWPIPIERPQARAVQRAVVNGHLDAPADWLRAWPGQPADIAGVLSADAHGRCIFHRGRRCDLQTALGHSTLPSCCQHFPRDCVIDSRGIFVTLSHYCPTAAELLFTSDAPLEIVQGPPPVGGAATEGLDARSALPPLLTRGVLMDLPGLTAWEGHLVAWLGGRRNPAGRYEPEATLALLESHATRLSRWRPGAVTLADAIGLLGSQPDATDVEPDWDLERELRHVARRALLPSHTWPDDPASLDDFWHRHRSAWRRHATVINRFLAAHAFASWMAYQGGGVIPGVRRLRLALAVLRAEVARVCETDRADVNAATLKRGIRQADLLVVHLIERQRLASLLSD
jgi:hypothetical protein